MALRQLLTQCCLGNEAEALETLRLNPGIFNDPWDGEEFRLVGGGCVYRGDTAIIAASQGGSEGLVRELVRLGAEVNARNGYGIGALMWGCNNGNAAVVAALLDNGANLDAQSNEGWDALMHASSNDHAPIVALLLGNGADANARNRDDKDALIMASSNGHARVVAVLLDHGADPNTRDQERSALGLAAANDHLHICQLLLGRGADLLAVNYFHEGSGNALERYGCMVNPRLDPAILEERREYLRLAFAEGPLVTQRRQARRMALRQLLVYCHRANEIEALETLRLNPGIINDTWDWEAFHNGGGEGGEWARDEYQGVTAIMAASVGGSEGLVRELVMLGADVNAFSANGVDALMCASKFGHAAVAAVLLDNGADPNSRNQNCSNARYQNCSALGLAAAFDRLPVCQLLLGRGADLLAVNAYHANGEKSGSALEIYGQLARPPLSPAILEERREALRVAFAEGPHESQVQRRRDERWARRWPFMLVLAGSGFRPLEARRLEMALRLLAVSEPSCGEAAGAPLPRRDECVRIVFRADNLVRLIVSFL